MWFCHRIDGLEYRAILILSIYVSHHIMDLESPIFHFSFKSNFETFHHLDDLETAFCFTVYISRVIHRPDDLEIA